MQRLERAGQRIKGKPNLGSRAGSKRRKRTKIRPECAGRGAATETDDNRAWVCGRCGYEDGQKPDLGARVGRGRSEREVAGGYSLGRRTTRGFGCLGGEQGWRRRKTWRLRCVGGGGKEFTKNSRASVRGAAERQRRETTEGLTRVRARREDWMFLGDSTEERRLIAQWRQEGNPCKSGQQECKIYSQDFSQACGT